MLVSVEALLKYMGGLTLTADQRSITENTILPGVQQELEEYLRRYVEKVHVREHRTPNDQGFIVFTQTPVWKVNSISRSDGTVLPVIAPPNPPPTAFVEVNGMRNVDYTAGGSNLAVPYEYFVGCPTNSPYWPLTMALNQQEQYYICDYVAGWDGASEQGLDLSIIRVAAREVERQFDDTFSIKGGTQDAAADSDTRPKMWTEEELVAWDRLRRRVIV